MNNKGPALHYWPGGQGNPGQGALWRWWRGSEEFRAAWCLHGPPHGISEWWTCLTNFYHKKAKAQEANQRAAGAYSPLSRIMFQRVHTAAEVLSENLRKIHVQDLSSFLYASKRCSSRSSHRLFFLVFERPCSALQESPSVE